MKASNLQCVRKDFRQLHQYIEKAYQDNPSFIFHKLRHHDFPTYHNAIHCQNTYLVNQWVVPLEGISSDLLFYLAIYMEEIPRVHDIQKHKLTTSEGQYNIITNKKWFASVSEMIQNNLQGCVDNIQSKHDIDLHGFTLHDCQTKIYKQRARI